MKRDIIITFVGYAFSFLFGIMVYRLAAGSLGPEGFGEYTLARRAESFMEPVLIMGLGVGIARYIAIYSSKNDGPGLASYLVAGYGIVIVFSLLALAIANIIPGVLGRAIFGRPGYEDYVRIISVLGESYTLNSLVYAFYRGQSRFKAASVISICTAAAPLMAVLAASSVKAMLELTAAGVFMVAVVFSPPVFMTILPRLKELRLLSSAKDLLRFGLARIPGDISMAGMLALPAFITSNLFGIRQAGYVAFGVSIVNMIGGVFQPVGLIMLPKMSSIVSEGRQNEARAILGRIIKYTALLSVGMTVILFISARYLLHYWLGPQFDEATGILRIAVLAAAPYALFVALRSSIDAAHVKAVNAGNVYKALSVSAAAYLVVKAGHLALAVIPVSFILGMMILCFLTLRVLLSTYGLTFKWSFKR